MDWEFNYQIWENRYALRDEQGKLVEFSPADTNKRLAEGAAKVYGDKNEYLEALNKGYVVPGGRVISSFNSGMGQTSFNCYVIDVEDSFFEGENNILEAVKNAATILALSGGVGLSFAKIRPKGSILKKRRGVAGGIIWAMRLFHDTVKGINVNNSRRSAMMFMIPDDHPDVIDVIGYKTEDIETIKILKKYYEENYPELAKNRKSFDPSMYHSLYDKEDLTTANISIQITDAFIEAYKNNADWNLKFNGQVYRTVKARWLFNLIITNAHKSGDPGVSFYDKIQKWNNTQYAEELIASNPCAEQNLPAFGVCCLTNINLSAMVENNEFNWELYKKSIHTGIKFLDTVVESANYALPKSKEVGQRTRRVGLGIMGLADMLIKLNIVYGSAESITFIDKLMQFHRDEAYRASIELSKKLGSFPLFDAEKYCATPFIQSLPDDIKNNIKQYGIRNAILLDVAPTGSTGLYMNVSSGCEPNFSKEIWRVDNITPNGRLIIHPLSNSPVFITANEVTATEHVLVEDTIAKYIDNSISKTVNMPEDASIEDVRKVFEDAMFSPHLKGVTVYRENSRAVSVLSKPMCTECKSLNVKIEDRCTVCYDCGYSACNL